MLKEGSRFVHVRGVGKSPARLAGELRVGDIISRHHEPHGYQVTNVREVTPHFVEVTEKHLKSGKVKKNKMKKTRLLAIKRVQESRPIRESQEIATLEELRDKLDEGIKQLFPSSFISVQVRSAIGKHITINFALEPKEQWTNSIYHNASYITAIIHPEKETNIGTFEVLSIGLDRALFKKLNFFKKKAAFGQLFDYIMKKLDTLKSMLSLKETSTTISMPITSTKPIPMKTKDEEKEPEFGKAYKGVVEALIPKSRRLYDFLEKNKENRHTWGADGFCTSCKKAHRTDFRKNDLCPVLMKKSKVKESLCSPSSPLNQYPELESVIDDYRVDESLYSPTSPVKDLSGIREILGESEELDNDSIDYFVNRYGEQNIVNFIYNRHCSRFDPHTTSIDDAIEQAWQYHTEVGEIISDLKTVEGYGDLDQYFRL